MVELPKAAKPAVQRIMVRTSSRSTLSLARARRWRISIAAGEESEANGTCGGKNAQENVLEEGEQ